MLRIKAVDHGSPPQENTQEYRIAVQDVNEFQPQFVKQKYEFSVKGNATNGTKIGTVRLSGNALCRVMDNFFLFWASCSII